MKVFLSPSNQDDNKYAYGNTTEAAVCGKIAEACEKALLRNGFEVKRMHMDGMAKKVECANAWGADLYIPIHSNAFNGEVSGTRMFYYSATGKKVCDAIFKRLAPITPGKSENIKQSSNLYELVNPKAYSAYVEVDFHDVPDVAKWIIEHVTEIAEAIAHGICDYAGVKYKESDEGSKNTDDNASQEFNAYKVKVSIDNLNIRKGPGTNHAKTGHYTGVGVFTIVDVKTGEGSDSGWGKLKSGAGWISLDYAKRV